MLPELLGGIPVSAEKPLMRNPLSTRVFENVSADLFQLSPLHVMVYADRLSRCPVVHQWRNDPSGNEFIQRVIENFVSFRRVSVRMRSDNGPQFEANSFQAKLRQWGVIWGIPRPTIHKVTTTRRQPLPQ
jgi:hypothetical protein